MNGLPIEVIIILLGSAPWPYCGWLCALAAPSALPCSSWVCSSWPSLASRGYEFMSTLGGVRFYEDFRYILTLL